MATRLFMNLRPNNHKESFLADIFFSASTEGKEEKNTASLLVYTDTFIPKFIWKDVGPGIAKQS